MSLQRLFEIYFAPINVYDLPHRRAENAFRRGRYFCPIFTETGTF